MYGLILTYLITVAASLSSLRYPVAGLFAYVCFGILRPRFLFGFAGEIRDVSFWVGVAMLVGWFLSGWGSWKFGRARAVVVALSAYVGWYVLSALFAIEPATAFAALVPLAKLVVPFVVGLTLLNTEKLQRWMLWTIVLTQGYVGFEMNLMYVTGYNAASQGFGGMDNNCFGASLVSTLGPALALALVSKTWYERGLASAAGALILHTTLLTFSRGAMVGMLAVGAVAFLMIPKNPKFLAAALLVGLLVVRFTGPELLARYSTAFASEEELDGSAESRIDLWRDCLRVIGEYPVFGVGPANWRVVAASYGWSEGKSAHSVWMETAAQVGLPGVMALMLFFGITAIRLWPIARLRQTDTNRFEVAIATGAVLSIIGFAVSGQFVSVPELEAPYYVTMVGAALLKTRSRQATSQAAPVVSASPNPSLSPLAPPLPLSRARTHQKSV